MGEAIPVAGMERRRSYLLASLCRQVVLPGTTTRLHRSTRQTLICSKAIRVPYVPMLIPLVINGVEIGGGSIRIHDRELQAQMFDLLGFSKEEAQKQFGFLMNAFEFGAPPHTAAWLSASTGFVPLFGGSDSIRDHCPRGK